MRVSTPLPPVVRVKISSEAAGAIALSPVVVQEIQTTELVRLMLGVARKDVDRIVDLLARGSLVSGASRFRWEPLPADAAQMIELLRAYPDDEPLRPLDWNLLRSVRFRSVELLREDMTPTRWLKRRSFFQALSSLKGDDVHYVEYSYKESADVYRGHLSPAEQNELRAAAPLLPHPAFRTRVAQADLCSLTVLISR